MWLTNHSSGGGGGLVVTLMTKTKLVLNVDPEPRMDFHKVYGPVPGPTKGSLKPISLLSLPDKGLI